MIETSRYKIGMKLINNFERFNATQYLFELTPSKQPK